ncbi:MAG: hypothetical protein HQ512_09180 [Rhodospirillales bacterium]|nr:hypothetical protein [Rhodospirillales bacterium]
MDGERIKKNNEALLGDLMHSIVSDYFDYFDTAQVQALIQNQAREGEKNLSVEPKVEAAVGKSMAAHGG